MIRLNEKEIEQYFDLGYLHVPNVYTPEEVEQCRAIIDEDQVSGGWQTAPYSTDSVTTDIYERLPALSNIIFNSNYVSIVKQLFAEEPIIIAEPAVHKSRYYYWHKDSTFITEQGEDYHLNKKFQAAMTVMYLQENHPDFGGGITLIPGSQWTEDYPARIPEMSLLERGVLKLKKTLRLSYFDKLDQHKDLLPIPTKLGDVLFIDMRLDHKGTPAKKASPLTKYGIMNIACKGEEDARKLQRTLRNRDSGYYKNYLRHEPDCTPVLKELSDKHDVKIIL